MEKEEDDVISTLPTDLLILIVERLDLGTQVRTTVLSTRWRHIAHQLSNHRLSVNSCFRTTGARGTAGQAMAAYAGASCSLLSCSSCSATAAAVKTLGLAFYLLDSPHLRSIGLLVDGVAGRGATEQLEIGIRPDCPAGPTIAQKTIFGQQFMSFFGAHPTTFRWLTRLMLCWVAIEVSDVHALINACERLQHLTLEGCWVVEFYSVLEVDAPRSQLEALVLTNFECAWIHLASLPNLKRLTCSSSLDLDEIPQVSFGYVPRLSAVSLDACAMHWHSPFALSEWLPHDQQLSILSLSFSSQMIWIRPEHPKQLAAIFRNLTGVYLNGVFVDCNLNWTLFFLEAAPSLHTFLIHRHSCPDKLFAEDIIAERTNVVWEPSKNWTKHLKMELLLMRGFEEIDMVINYLRLVMERAVGLKRIELSDNMCKVCHNPINQQIVESSSSPSRFPVDEASRLRVIERLTSGFSSRVKIIIR